MAKDCHCKKSEECEECPEWIFTFADLVMLMMGFFVILWVLKPPAGKQGQDAAAQAKWLDTVAAIRESFGYRPRLNSTDPVDMRILMSHVQLTKPDDGPGHGGKTPVKPKSPRGAEPETSSIRPGNFAAEGGRLLFDRGQYTLRAPTKQNLDAMADMVRGFTNIVIVKGHASLDDLPEGATTSQAMELSVQRAQAAADYLISKGVAPAILRIQGCSTFEPVIQHVIGDDALAANRRVEIEATNMHVQDRQDAAHRAVAKTLPTDEIAAPTGN